MMFRNCISAACISIAFSSVANAQVKTKLENVATISLKNAGVIRKQNDIRGYYFFYESDKIDRETSEYTLQVLDENLNAAKPTKLTLDKKTFLLESATNESSVCFMFLNQESKALDYKIYDGNGKLVYTYSVPIDKTSRAYFLRYMSAGGETGGW